MPFINLEAVLHSGLGRGPGARWLGFKSWAYHFRPVCLDFGASQVVLVVKNPPANAGET